MTNSKDYTTILKFIKQKHKEGQFKDRVELRKEIQSSLKVKESRGREIAADIEIENGRVYTGNGSKKVISPKEETITVTTSVSSLEEVLKFCKVDLNKWYVEKYSIDQAANDKNGNVQFRWKLDLKRSKEDITIELVNDFKKIFTSIPLKKFTYKEPNQSGKVFEIDIADAHISKLVWPNECNGGDYNLRLAVSEFKDTIADLVTRIQYDNVETILFPVLGDFFNSDNIAGTTTAGTPQATSEDTRWQKTFTTGCNLLAEVIESLAIDYKVEVPIIPGNHDYERSYYLGEFLRAYFRNHPNVKINNEPTQRKYFVFGQNMILYTHGNEEKITDLPMIMATERKLDWGKTKYRFIHLGHHHKQEVTENHGVVTRIIRALVPSDAWMTSKGYVGNIRGGQAFLYDPDLGQVAQFMCNK